ncbi:zinc-binding alcohol dehydrogenase family protein [Paenibacillus sp. Marseille-Q7038]
MQKMKAVGLYAYLPIDHLDSLLDVEVPKPKATGRDILVKVKAIAVNPVDAIVRSPKPDVEEEPKILGWDVAGVVEEVGHDCTLFKPGDEVYYAGSITRQGGNSEYHLVDERIVGRKPVTLDYAQAAALPLTTITAYESLFDRLQISHDMNENKSILIIGAAGGVGSIAIQLAKLAGLTTIGTASRLETTKWIKDLGADHVINHYEEFIPQLRELGIDTVDYILCLSKTEEYWEAMEKVIAPQGKICSIVETDEKLDLTLMKNKSVTFVWEMVFTRSMYGTNDMIEQHHILNKVARLIDAGKIRTTLSERLSPINAEKLKEAHKKVESRTVIGKIVLENF